MFAKPYSRRKRQEIWAGLAPRAQARAQRLLEISGCNWSFAVNTGIVLENTSLDLGEGMMLSAPIYRADEDPVFIPPRTG